MRNRQNTGSHQAVTGSHMAVPKPRRRGLKLNLNISKHKVYIAITVAVVVLITTLAVCLRVASDKRSYSEYYSRAVQSYYAGNYDSALTDLRKAANISKTDECMMLMADCYETLGNLDKALEILRMLDTRDPVVAERIAAIENARDMLASASKVKIADKEYDIGTPALTLKDMALTDEVLDGVSKLYALTSLNLSGNSLTDVEKLSTLGGLTTLDLSGNSISDLDPLSKLGGLRILYIDNNPICDFSALYKLSNLTVLSIKGIEISEDQLKELSEALPNCAIHSDNAAEDVPEISLMGVTFKSDVEELDLSNMGITDISALSICRNLKRLNLNGNSVSDLMPLMDIPGLEKLYIKDNIVTDLRPLMALTTLKSINAEGNGISSTVPLSYLANLTELHLAGNPISDYSGLSKLSSLETLGLENTGLKDEDLEHLKGMSSLKLLTIYDNPELGGEAVDQLGAAIATCYIEHSELVYSVEIGGVSFRQDAAEVELNNKGLTDISAIGLFNKLEKLSLRGNSLENIYILQFVPGVKHLDLACNNISDATPLAYLSRLETLDVSSNSLNSVTPFINLSNLKELNISGNDISADQIEKLRLALPACNVIAD